MQNNENATDAKKQENATKTGEQENFTTQLFHEFKRQQRSRMIISAISIIGLVIIILAGLRVHSKSEREWKELFNSYDFVSQDGEGINNINNGEQGDLNNGAESENKEE